MRHSVLLYGMKKMHTLESVTKKIEELKAEIGELETVKQAHLDDTIATTPAGRVVIALANIGHCADEFWYEMYPDGTHKWHEPYHNKMLRKADKLLNMGNSGTILDIIKTMGRRYD